MPRTAEDLLQELMTLDESQRILGQTLHADRPLGDDDSRQAVLE